MAKKPTSKEKLQITIKRLINFIGFTKAYMRKNNPIKKIISQLIEAYTELTTMKKKLKRIENRINYERYKLKKTELILAQNSDHLFLRGRSLDSTR